MSNNRKFNLLLLSVGIGFVTLMMLSKGAFAQSSPIGSHIFLPLVTNGVSRPVPETLVPYYMQPFPLHSGVYNGAVVDQGAVLSASFQKEIQVKGAPWLRIFFGESNLGRESYVEIISPKDGGQQRLYALDLALRENRSAFFNGDTVEVKLFTAPGDTGIFFQVQEIMIGEWAATVPDSQPAQQPFPILPGLEPAETRMICTPTDDRMPSGDAAVGRVMPVGCTAWIASTGVYLTAGHCADRNRDGIVDAAFQELQFHVPASTANGGFQPPATEHQYTIIQTSIRFRNAADHDGVGGDWAVFAVQPQLDGNSGKRRLPTEAQQSFYRMSRDASPANIRVTGYGVDGPAPCFGQWNQPGCNILAPPRNNDSQTLQTHVAPSRGEHTNRNGLFWNHQVDITGGTSGSPLIDADSNRALTVGINTHGTIADATCTTDFNSGTSFENDDLEQAIAEFYGTDFVYIDAGHPIASSLEDGTVFRPFNHISEGVNRVPTGGTLSIVMGTYNGSVTINRSMVLTAPVGTVTIIGQ